MHCTPIPCKDACCCLVTSIVYQCKYTEITNWSRTGRFQGLCSQTANEDGTKLWSTKQLLGTMLILWLTNHKCRYPVQNADHRHKHILKQCFIFCCAKGQLHSVQIVNLLCHQDPLKFLHSNPELPGLAYLTDLEPHSQCAISSSMDFVILLW